MKIYYYHTQDIQRIWREWQQGIFPGHFLYGATHFREHNIDMVLHRFVDEPRRWKLMLKTSWRILTCRERYDILYGTSFRGIEPIIFLRALRLYRHRIIIWHHQPIVKSPSRLRESIARLFYRGIDEMFFFSDKLVSDSRKSDKAKPGRMHVAHWGPDLLYYDRFMREHPVSLRQGFISSGKELRDMPTLVAAFNQTGEPLDIFVRHTNGNKSYDDIFSRLSLNDNVRLHFTVGLIPHELCEKVNAAACVAICCLESNYTVGLTTVVEAMALGLPIICSRNPQMPMDIDREGIGITVDYGDVEGWTEAIRWMAGHTEEARQMGQRGRQLAERTYNITRCTEEIAQVLLNA